jgi:1,2-diacylglycerol 3-alpha-glucosyltransferase
MKVAIFFDNFGPYHSARLEAASHVCTLLAVQINQRSRDYAWTSPCSPRGPLGRPEFVSVTLNQADRCRLWNFLSQNWRLVRTLADFAPDCVFIPGWSRISSLAALGWCRANSVPAVMMSESTEHDSPRSRYKEWLKSKMLSSCSAALVGGSAHAKYLAKLGVGPEKIFDGYDVVDNDYFQRASQAVRARNEELRAGFGLPDQYFLASARFIQKKNLLTLLEAYARYRENFGVSDYSPKTSDSMSGQPPWSLVILGDGPQRHAIENLISKLHLESWVRLPGFRQYHELPLYYGLAGAFVHASTSEPWGLVVNEAMASGLPVLVSNRCGCAPDLVRDGRNGFTFDPKNVQQLSELMEQLATAGSNLAKMSEASWKQIFDWGPTRFGRGFQTAAEKAIEQSRSSAMSLAERPRQCTLQ